MKNICYYIYTTPKSYYEIGISSLQKYCNTHNIELRKWDTFNPKYTLDGNHTEKNVWLQKFAIIEDFVNSDYDNMMAVDIDMLFNSEAPNIFELITDDLVYQQYAPNVMIEINNEYEVGNGGLYLFNKKVASTILSEIQPDKLEMFVCDQKNFAKARIRAHIPFKKVDDKWNYTFWSLPNENVVNELNNNNIYFLHYGNANIHKMDMHLKNETFKNKVL